MVCAVCSDRLYCFASGLLDLVNLPFSYLSTNVCAMSGVTSPGPFDVGMSWQKIPIREV